MKTNFTSGPWRHLSHGQIGTDAGVVCEVWAAIGWGEAAIGEAGANIRLIAAAPEMFEALQLLAQWREVIEKLPSFSTKGAMLEDFDDARAAIAKALGE